MKTALCFLVTFAATGVDAAIASEQPNVVLIMSDDQGWGDLGSHGNPKINTPVLDKLRNESVRFDRFYVSPVCAPTRASLLTGRYAPRTGVSGVTGRREVMSADEVTLAEVLGPAGYVSGLFGKWHNGRQFPNDPHGQGFDEFVGFTTGHWNNYFNAVLQHSDREQGGQSRQTDGYITDVLTDMAIRFIDNRRDYPFFCYVPYNAPHTPWQVPDEWFERCDGRGLDGATQSASAMVENIDHNVSRILAALVEQKLTENTIVIFLTDNGPNGDRYNGGMRGRKASVHEGGVRVPCFIRWPGTLKPTTVTQIAAHVDLLPTIAELCGVELPATKPLDGRSLVPLLKGEATGWSDRKLITFRKGRGAVQGAVRTQRFRFIRERSDQLYDMDNDPEERRNVAAQHPAVFEELQSAFNDFIAEVSPGIESTPPVPVGYSDALSVELPAVDADLHGDLRFENGQGYAHDWITGWTNSADKLTWRIDVSDGGNFEAVLSYACAADCRGTHVQLSSEAAQIQATISSPFTSSRQPRPERHMPDPPRWIRDFTTLPLGELSLPAGPNTLTLMVPSASQGRAIDVDGVRLRRITKPAPE